MVRLNVTRELDEHLAVKREHFPAIQAHQLPLIATSWIYEAIPCLTAPWDEDLRDLTLPGQRLERAIRRRTADARTLRAHETKDVVHTQVSIGVGGKKRGDGLPQRPGWYQPVPRGLEAKIAEKLALQKELDQKSFKEKK